jgi:hypothetical protein
MVNMFLSHRFLFKRLCFSLAGPIQVALTRIPFSSHEPWGVTTHRMEASLITTAHSSQKLAGKP